MKSKIFSSNNLNNIIFIVLLLVIIIIVCYKSITIHNNIMEQFADGDNEETTNDIDEEVDDALKDVLGSIESNNNNESEETDAELEEKCKRVETTGFGSITSKYSGKSINVEALPPVKGSKRKYMIQWQPVGGKPGGCITANADGTYSTPICNANINKQQWFIKEVKNEDEYLELIPKDRQTMGRSMDETEFPFYIVQSSEFENYCLHYEGGGLAIREIANYDSQKWDVSKDKVYQEPLPTQGNNKFTGLTPGHRMTNADKSLGSVGENGGNGEGGQNPMQFNINLDPDLLSKLGIKTGLEGMNSNGGANSNGGSSETYNSGINNKGNGLLISEEQLAENRKNGNTDEMMVNYNGNEELCSDCGKIPDNMIRKDLVKSMCIGCNNIDNVLE